MSTLWSLALIAAGWTAHRVMRFLALCICHATPRYHRLLLDRMEQRLDEERGLYLASIASTHHS
jgi:hypothetical protein